MADISGQVTVDTADEAVAEVVSVISNAFMTEGFYTPVAIDSITLETYFGSWALIAEYHNDFNTFEIIVVALQEAPGLTVSPSAMINARALNVATPQITPGGDPTPPTTVAAGWEAAIPLAFALAIAAAYGVTPTIMDPLRKASPTSDIVSDTVIAAVELPACFITLTLTGRFFKTEGSEVLGPQSGTPVQNQSTFVGTLPGDLQQLVSAVEDVASRDATLSINQGAAAFTVEGRVMVP